MIDHKQYLISTVHQHSCGLPSRFGEITFQQPGGVVWGRIAAHLPFPAHGMLASDIYQRHTLKLDLVNGRGLLKPAVPSASIEPMSSVKVQVGGRSVRAVIDFTVRNSLCVQPDVFEHACPLKPELQMQTLNWGTIKTRTFAVNMRWNYVQKTSSMGLLMGDAANELQDQGVEMVLGNEWLANGRLVIDPSTGLRVLQPTSVGAPLSTTYKASNNAA